MTIKQGKAVITMLALWVRQQITCVKEVLMGQSLPSIL